MRFIKASATGNDFLVVDLTAGARFDGPREAWVRAACDRHEGVGADGAIFLEGGGGEADVRWDFFNADGGRAEMCGNATRAIGLYLHDRSRRDEFRIATAVGVVRVKVHSPDRIASTLPPIGEIERRANYVFVRAGVPHAVVRTDDIDDRARLKTRALAIKAAPEFAAEGVNVTFYAPDRPTGLRAITFERGVEDFTLSCGTGATAAAFASELGSSVEVRVPGGQLGVVCDRTEPVLTGPARLIARGEWLGPEGE